MASSPDALTRAKDLVRRGELAQAETALRRLLARGEDQATQAELARVLLAQGRADQAAYFAERVIASRSAPAEALVVVGILLDSIGRFDMAARAFESAAMREPDSPAAHNGLGLMLMRRRRPDEAIPRFERARSLAPDSPGVLANLAWAKSESWRVDEAIDLLREGLASHPDSLDLLAQLPYLLNYSSRATPREVFEAHRALGALVERGAAGAEARIGRPLASPGLRDADRSIRAGLLSGDFREHSVARFIEPLLREHDRGGVTISCWSTASHEDSTTARLRGLASSWHDVSRLDDDLATRAMREAGLDVLVDLAGHTRGSRPGVLARRAAPLQVTYLGYPNTTGLRTVDARIVDAVTDPPGEADSLATERLVRLDPCFACIEPAPAARTLPPRGASAPDAPVTFGSFNHPMKLSAATIDAWSAILRAIPESRLLLKGAAFGEGPVAERVRATFGARGIDTLRIELVAFAPTLEAHLSLYSRVDIALDPLPYNGTTTTCEALWMGVPVVTLVGASHAGRVGASLLHAAGLPELVAPDFEAYVDVAASLARDAGRRARYHATVRDRLLASPLGDARGFASRFAALLRSCWRERCAESVRPR